MANSNERGPLTAWQKREGLAKLRRLLCPRTRYCIQFNFKGGPAPCFRVQRYWAVNGRVAWFPSAEAAWLALSLLPWANRAHADGYRVVSATVHSQRR